jgi:alkylation response protein AidB-like acyl-CoA dehydrogenase
VAAEEGADIASFRASVRSFIEERLPPRWAGFGALEGPAFEDFCRKWRRTLAAPGYLAPSWPKEYGGGGLGPLESVVLAEELQRARVPSGGPNDAFGVRLLGNTILRWGTEDQRRRLLPRILSGEDSWCQGYSEPDAGSDLGNLRCRAEPDGDDWVINGQKLWTTAARSATWIFLLARTDPDSARHRGISFLLCPLDQPGVQIRPIRMMSGEEEFNEVFFSGARTDKANVIGPVGAGWDVAMTLLGFERGSTAATLHLRFRDEFDRLLALARLTGAAEVPRLRDRLAKCYAELETMRFAGYRALSTVVDGHEPGPEASISKLLWSEYHQRLTELAVDILGPAAMTPAGRRPSSQIGTDDLGAPATSTASWVDVFLNARAGTIYQGTSEIQRNTLAERVLGLPREPSPTRAGG